MARFQKLWPVLAFTLLTTTAVAMDPKGGERVTTDETSPGLTAAVAGNTRFALDLYSNLKGRAGNLFFSPYSLSSALAMTSAGARGETARAMTATLHLSPDPATSHAAFGSLMARINGGKPSAGETLTIANALWGQTGEAFLADFLQIARTHYGAGLEQVDFAADPEAARQTINAWVEKQTQDKIRDLIGPSVLTRQTSLVLTNAIYFKAAWQSPFHEAQTRKEAIFRALGGRKVTVPMMAQTGHFGYHDGGTFQAVELPYRGNERSMVVLLPKQVDGLGALEDSLNEAKLSACIKGLANKRVELELPRFQLSEGFELSKVLSALGMGVAFDPSRADFSGMTGQRDRYVSNVLHKAYVDVNEAGTEAAAATAVVMMPTAMPVATRTVEFHADHPFLFLIRDRSSGSVLFLGRVVDPKHG